MTAATLTPQTRNVTRAFRQASAYDHRAGREWYARARRVAEELAAEYGGTAERAAAVLAVTSPRLEWSRNVRKAREAYRRYYREPYWESLPGLTDASDKAYALLAGEDPAAVVRGAGFSPKVTAFWLTIVDPSNPESVAVDRHAVDIALGRVTDDATHQRWARPGKRYAQTAECYARAARILSREHGETITPADVQAVTWTYWRRLKTGRVVATAFDLSDPTFTVF